MGRKNVGMGIGMMVLAAFGAFILFALLGGICILWFNGSAKPINTRLFRTAADWCKMFAMFFYGGCAVSLIFTLIMALLGGKGIAYRRINCVINLIVETFIGLIPTILFYILAPTKTVGISAAAAIIMFLQGFGIFFIAQLFAPKHWDGYRLLG